jgi:two-component system, NarL family, nitrate/nitrite response regulator NarL
LPFLNPRIRSAFDGIPSHVAILDSAGSIIYVNEAWRAFAAQNDSHDPQAYLGASYLDVCRRSAEAGDALASEALDGIRSVISGKLRRFVQRYPCPARGLDRWFMMTATRGRIGCEIVIAHDDVTAIVRAENIGAADRLSSRHSNPESRGLTIVLVHPSKLFSESLRSLLQSASYKLHTDTLEAMDFETYLQEDNLVFLVGGRSRWEIEETIRGIRDRLPSAFIVVISATGHPSEVKLALEAGANCYLRDAMTSQTLLTAIELVLQGQTILPSEFLKSLPNFGGGMEPADSGLEATNGANADPGPAKTSAVTLSAREETILQALVDGAPNKVIAQRLDITEATVKAHVKAILRKIRVQNRTQAAMWAVKHRAFARRPSGLHTPNGRG